MFSSIIFTQDSAIESQVIQLKDSSSTDLGSYYKWQSQYYEGKRNFSLAAKNLEIAIEYYQKKSGYEYNIFDRLDLQKLRILKYRSVNNDCQPFMVKNSDGSIEELRSGDSLIYFFIPSSIEKKNNILLVWAFGLYVGDIEGNSNYKGIIKNRTLSEYDFNKKMCRGLKLVEYDDDGKIISNTTLGPDNWDYLIPGSIGEEMFKYLSTYKKSLVK